MRRKKQMAKLGATDGLFLVIPKKGFYYSDGKIKSLRGIDWLGNLIRRNPIPPEREPHTDQTLPPLGAYPGFFVFIRCFQRL
jgi:hypothetical protein